MTRRYRVQDADPDGDGDGDENVESKVDIDVEADVDTLDILTSNYCILFTQVTIQQRAINSIVIDSSSYKYFIKDPVEMQLSFVTGSSEFAFERRL